MPSALIRISSLEVGKATVANFLEWQNYFERITSLIKKDGTQVLCPQWLDDSITWTRFCAQWRAYLETCVTSGDDCYRKVKQNPTLFHYYWWAGPVPHPKPPTFQCVPSEVSPGWPAQRDGCGYWKPAGPAKFQYDCRTGGAPGKRPPKLKPPPQPPTTQMQPFLGDHQDSKERRLEACGCPHTPAPKFVDLQGCSVLPIDYYPLLDPAQVVAEWENCLGRVVDWDQDGLLTERQRDAYFCRCDEYAASADAKEAMLEEKEPEQAALLLKIPELRRKHALIRARFPPRRVA